MRKELEYAKKMVLVCKLFRDGLLSEKEYFKVKSKLMDMYYVAEKKNEIDNCPNCKSIDESVLEGAFVEAFRLLAGSFDDVMESVLSTIEEVLKDDTDFKRVKQLEKDISNLETRKSRKK